MQQNPETFIRNLLTTTYPKMDTAGISLMVEDTLPVLEDWIFAKINDQLSIEKNAELADLMQEEYFDMKKVYDFLCQHIKDYPARLANRYQEFGKKYLEEVKKQ